MFVLQASVARLRMIVITLSSAGMDIAEIPGSRVCVHIGRASQRSRGGSGTIFTQEIAILSVPKSLFAIM